jgi:hypothetical protein
MTGDTLLLRQVNPNWLQQGRVTSQVFKPTRKDENRVSVYDGALITPENAWKHFTEKLGFASIGVLAVSVDECQGCDLPTSSDPAPFPEHAIIDFTAVAPNQIDTKAKLLRAFAVDRDWLYQPKMSPER